MNKKLTHYITLGLLSLMLSVFVSSCGNSRHTNQVTKLKKKNDKELEAALLEQNKIDFDFLSVRIGVDLKSKKQNNSFSCYVKLKIDSAFSGSIKKGPAVFATYLITQDSITFVDKWNDCYFAESLSYVSTLFGTTVEFDFFQDLLLGLPIGFDGETKYQQINNDGHYILSSHKERDYRKLENDRLNLEEDLVLIQYHLDPENLEVSKIEMNIPLDTTSITVNYLERKLEEGRRLPEATSIEIVNPRDSVFIQLNYAPITLNEPKRISIKIPSSYVECP